MPIEPQAASALDVDGFSRLLTAAPNFRDIGGTRAVDGRTVKPGLIFRSDALDELEADDLTRLDGMAIKLCCDLRSDGERLHRPSRWLDGRMPRTLAMPVATDIRALMPGLVRQLRDNPGVDGARELMRHLYRELPISCAPVLGRLFALVAEDPDALPLVVHCTAGKDRTGFVVAMLLHGLGVSRETITADYLATNGRGRRLQSHRSVERLLHALIGVAPEADTLAVIMAAHRDYLDASFARIEEDHGAVDVYLDQVAGLDAGRRQALKTALLTD